MKKFYDITMILTLIVVVFANLITMLYVNYLGEREKLPDAPKRDTI